MTPIFARLTLLSPSANLLATGAVHTTYESGYNAQFIDAASLRNAIIELLENKQPISLLLQDLSPILVSSLLNILEGNCLFDMDALPNSAMESFSQGGPFERVSPNLASCHPSYPENMHQDHCCSEWLSRVNEEIEKKIDDETLRASSIAKVIGLCEMQFHRKMKKSTGLSPANYLRCYRLRKCLPLLENGTQNVSEIAYSVGFKSLEYFSRSFKKEFGFSPSSYQQKFQHIHPSNNVIIVQEKVKLGQA